MLSIALELIGSFLAGVIITPVVIEIYRQYAKTRMDKAQDENRGAITGNHGKRMRTLYKRLDREIDEYNTKMEKLKRKLTRQNLSVQIDEEGNEILIKREYRRTFRVWR